MSLELGRSKPVDGAFIEIRSADSVMAAHIEERKLADLAGPGIGTYEEVERVLPSDYHSLLDAKTTQRAIYAVKGYIEDHVKAGGGSVRSLRMARAVHGS